MVAASTLGESGASSEEESTITDPTELQSVTTAITVLKQHVTQPNVKISDWKKLQGTETPDRILVPGELWGVQVMGLLVASLTPIWSNPSYLQGQQEHFPPFSLFTLLIFLSPPACT